MGRIKKAATERHLATLSPFVKDFVKRATEVPLHQLPAHLDSFPQSWPLPRGDLYHWIPLLDRFDHILELFNTEYGLKEGPQSQPFGQRLLEKGDLEEGMPYPASGIDSAALKAVGYSEEGDRELVESVVNFTRILLEHCGNRSLYASSSQVNDLLHTTSLSLLRLCLRLSLRLAQRYQVARYKNHNPNAQAVLLANHYNLNLDNLHKIASPFPKPYSLGSAVGQTPGKAKEKAAQALSFNPADLVALAKEPIPASLRNDLSDISLSYYDQSAASSRPTTSNVSGEPSPSTPTPTRRTSNLGPSRDRPTAGDRSASANDVSGTPVVRSRELDVASSTAPKLFHIPANKVAQTPAWSIVKDGLHNVPADVQYELLNRVRIAKAFASPEVSGQQLVEIRLLAICNLAYAYNDSKFQEKIGIPDGEEPRRYHLAQQLCDLLQPATSAQKSLTLQTETTVVAALEALAKTRHKVTEVAEALAITVNHGVLYYELRKVIASLSGEEHKDKQLELSEAEWREATFDLINSLLQSNAQARYGEKMVAAGIMGILVEALPLRTSRAENFYEKVLQFFDSFIHGIPTAFQNLANIKGLDMIADLTAHQVNAALESAHSGHGLPPEFKSKVVDYDIPFHQQSTLRQLFKNTVHMFEHNAGTHDRLLRNLIDTPQILGALRNVIESAQIFGSNVWSGAVNIVSSFIHNEPTSYQVIGEAGLSRSLLESITGQKIPEELPPLEDFTPPSEYEDLKVTSSGEPDYPSVAGILPVGEVMCDIPTSFGAICLNETGMQLFQASGALTRYFDIFLSPAHVRAMEEDSHTAANIGQSFDELSRHQPRLKPQINAAVLNMLKRLGDLCNALAQQGAGAKLWQRSKQSFAVAGGSAAIAGSSAAIYEEVVSGARPLVSQTAGEPIVDDGSEDEKERAPALPFLSACIKFLEGFFHNSGMCSLFCEASGAELLLDLVTSPSIPFDVVAFQIFSKFTPVLKAMCEAKPHLVLPSIIRRMQHAMLGLKGLTDFDGPRSSFAAFATLDDSNEAPLIGGLDGTTVLKSLVNMHQLTHAFARMLAPPPYTLRHGNQHNHLFTYMNFTEIYVEFIEELGKLHASCLWEGLVLTRDVSEESKIKSDPSPYKIRRLDANGIVELAGEKSAETSLSDRAAASRETILARKNLRAVRYLLSQVPVGIESLFHSLGQAIVTKRLDTTTKRHAMYVADRIAQTLIFELEFRPKNVNDETCETKYIAGILAMIGRVLLRNSISMDSIGNKEALTLVLTRLYVAGGFRRINEHLGRFVHLLAQQQEGVAVEAHVKEAVQVVLNFYSHIVRSKCINEASQTSFLISRHQNEADYFQPGQFLVEIRDAVLPAISQIWHSKDVEKLTDAGMKCVVDILRLILKAEGEERALRRTDNATRHVLASPPDFKLSNAGSADLTRLTDALGFDVTLSREALYRCNYNSSNAEAYCRLRVKDASVPRFPVPEGESSTEDGPAAAESVADVDMGGATAEEPEAVLSSAQNPPALPIVSDGNAAPASGSDNDLMSDDDDDMNMGSLGVPPVGIGGADMSSMVDARALEIFNSSRGVMPSKDTDQKMATVDDLDDKRKSLRDDLVDRCLDVLSTQPNITFELADLIQAAVAKAGEGANPRADVALTLLHSLMSLQGEEEGVDEGAKTGLKIHAYAHLVALILQDRDFFDSTLDELKEYFGSFVEWVRLEPDQKAEDAPWIEMVLVIIERVLAEDEQPVQIEWHAPPADDPLKPMPQPSAPALVVAQDLRSDLFDALVDLLPKIGKNRTLALSVCRVLVVLTRRHELASRLSDKHTMGRLFVMIRQLAGSVDDKIQSSFMLILRQMIEDEATIRNIMKAEVRVAFDNHRSSRAMDTTTYTRNMYHLALRNPQIFVEVTQEMLEVSRYDGNPNRAQSLGLKKDNAVPGDGQAKDAAVDTENESSETSKLSEPKPPTVESTDGVIQFLLRELSNWRDVEDKVPALAKEGPESNEGSSTPADVDMQDAVAVNGTNAVPADVSNKNKPTFKPEEHAAYIYRCFILQCLAELLSCYNRTKVDFINFSRKSDAQPSTPSKPRAGTLNYLLNVLLPVGTLEHRDDIAHRKKVATSTWASSVLVALCTKTQERHLENIQAFEAANFTEQEPELTFVRKFVLEHALRAFKEATASQEPLDQRYARLLALGDLFNRMLQDKVDLQRSNVIAAGNFTSHQQMGRFMYEKNFIPTLTSAIAELDLNFPNAKRAVKYILNPLKQLTELGVTLSQTTDLSSSGPGTSADEEEEEVSSATSMSEDEQDDREQTPNMYRDSSLGMFETGGQEEDDMESGSEEDEDDEMYDDGYDEEMDYEEEQMAEHGDVVSDEDDDELGDMGEIGDIEGVPGDIEIEVDMMDEDEDEDSDDDEDEDDSEDSDDDPDMDPAMEEIMDEITGDDANASMGEQDDEGDWEEDGLDFGDDGGAAHDGGSPHGGPLEHIAHVLGAEDPSDMGEPDGVVRIDIGNGEEEFFDDEMPPEDEDDEDEEAQLAEDIVYEPEMEDEEDDDAGAGWAWETHAMGGAPAILRGGHIHHHHHHHPRGLNEMLGMIGGDGLRPSGLTRSHRSLPNNRDEDGINPLLQRDNANAGSRRERDAFDMAGRLSGRRNIFPRHDVLQDLIATVGHPGGGPGVININVDPGAVPGLSALPPMLIPHGHGAPAAMMDLDPRRPWREALSGRWADTFPGSRFNINDRAHGTSDEAQAVEFRAVSTAARWQEAARMLFPGKFQEKATRVINTILSRLVPAAMEAKRIRDKEAAERLEAQRAEDRKKAEKEAQEKKEREEREAKEREQAEAEARALREAEEAARAETEAQETASMEGVEQEEEQQASAEAQPEAGQTDDTPAERVTVNIRGRELDITSLGIDREYIEALPEDMREEVIMAQFAEQRSQQVESGQGPSEISREFLEALPRDIQQELLRSEQMERRRRERDEARRRNAQEGAAQQPEEMNNADFMAMLDPGLRQAVLMDADDSILAALPEELQAEARALVGDRRMPRADQAGRLPRGMDAPGARMFNGPPGGTRTDNNNAREASRPRRPIAQMLDKSGIATLLRLMFVSLNHKSKTNLHSILSDVCKNVRNRSEVISILLAILQDGTADVNAVERSFAHLSLRAKQPTGPQTPQPLKRSLTGQPGVAPSTELSPLNIVQQCLGTLNALSNDNPRVKSFFLSEHETITSQKIKSAKKGKGKESKAVKFPLNALLTLLDRKLITENTAVMETLASLLSNVTRPLTVLLKRAKEAQDAEKASAGAGDVAEGNDSTEPADRPQTSVSDVSMQEVPEASTEGTASREESTAESKDDTSKAKPSKKSQSDLVPPEVPHENMRLVVNILAARECPAKTFSDTLDIIKNMSAIPGAKEVFGRELIRQAQELGDVLLADLEELAKQINAAQPGTDLQGMALASFSSAGAKQRRLLRVLVALDHVFDPKRTPTVSTATSSGDDVDQKLKDDILATLYESPAFDKLWKSLSQCLTAIRQRGDMVNVATILLPLIESLMVVCRNSALKDNPSTSAETAGTPSPEARMESLFFNFTEEHRKILNELIRNNPKLMNGNLSVLAKNSKVLEFDNKRSYFSRRLHDRRSEVRMAHPSLQLSVRRDQVFLDSFKSLYYKTGNEIKYGKLNIRFHGEEGVDAGGVSREWFAAMARQMFNPDYALFNPVASDRTTFHPNTLSGINHEHLMFFKFIGRIIGKALYENRVLDCHFSRAVYRKILGKSVSLKDMETLDLDYYKSLVWILENDITDVTFETFSVDVDRFGLTETIDLIPNGRDIAVTEENKDQYVRLVVEYRLIKSVQEQLDHFLEGFHEIIPAELVSIFNEQELELLISGLPDIDVDDWKNNTEYHNYQPTSPQIQWFWRAVRSFDKEEKAKLLQFVTGTSKVPLNGFKELEGMNGFAKFNIHRDYSNKEKLPSSHTCFNQLDLPEYESYEHLRQQLYTAITAGSEYFGFA